jgi:hypothetical protein
VKATLAETRTIWRAPNAVAAARCFSALQRLGLRHAHIAILRFLDALVPPGVPPFRVDETDWPRFPGI